jgi:hypothetical protein
MTILVENAPGDPDLAVPASQRARYEAAWRRFCSVFPDMFYKVSRGSGSKRSRLPERESFPASIQAPLLRTRE